MEAHCSWERKQKKNFHLEEVPEYILDPDQYVSYRKGKSRIMEKSYIQDLKTQYLSLRLNQNSKDSALLTNQWQCTAKREQETLKRASQRVREKIRTEDESWSRSWENYLTNQCPPWTQGNTRFEPCGARRVNIATINAQLSSIPISIDSNQHPSSLKSLGKEKAHLFPGIKIIYLSLLSYKKYYVAYKEIR